MSSLGTSWFLFVTVVRPCSSDSSSQNPLLESHPVVRLPHLDTCSSGHRQALDLRRRPFRTSRCWNLDSPISPVVALSSLSGSSFWRRSRDALGALWLGCSLTIVMSSSSDDSPSSPLLESHPLVQLSLYVGVYHPRRQASGSAPQVLPCGPSFTTTPCRLARTLASLQYPPAVYHFGRILSFPLVLLGMPSSVCVLQHLGGSTLWSSSPSCRFLMTSC